MVSAFAACAAKERQKQKDKHKAGFTASATRALPGFAAKWQGAPASANLARRLFALALLLAQAKGCLTHPLALLLQAKRASLARFGCQRIKKRQKAAPLGPRRSQASP